MNSDDVVVVLPGIMGSTLGVRGKDGSPAGDNLFWAPSGGAVWKLLTGRDSILAHELPEGELPSATGNAETLSRPMSAAAVL